MNTENIKLILKKSNIVDHQTLYRFSDKQVICMACLSQIPRQGANHLFAIVYITFAAY